MLDGLPLLKFDLAQHVALDDDHFVHLVDLCVDDFVLNRIDRPQLNFANVDLHREHTDPVRELIRLGYWTYIEQLGQLCEGKVRDLGVERANLDVGLLNEQFVLGQPLVLHKAFKLAQFTFELLRCGLGKQV